MFFRIFSPVSKIDIPVLNLCADNGSSVDTEYLSASLNAMSLHDALHDSLNDAHSPALAGHVDPPHMVYNGAQPETYSLSLLSVAEESSNPSALPSSFVTSNRTASNQSASQQSASSQSALSASLFASSYRYAHVWLAYGSSVSVLLDADSILHHISSSQICVLILIGRL